MDGRQAPARRRGAEEINAPLRIRPALPADAPVLCGLDSFAARAPARRGEIARWLASARVFLAERDGVALGYGVTHDHFFGRDFLELVMVDATARGQGIGTALILHARRACRSDCLWTSTNSSNLPMQSLLERLGFIRSGRVEGLDEGDPEIFFRAPAERFHPPLVE